LREREGSARNRALLSAIGQTGNNELNGARTDVARFKNVHRRRVILKTMTRRIGLPKSTVAKRSTLPVDYEFHITS